MTNRLQELRIKHGETQRQMAEVMKLKTVGAYCKKELGYNAVTLEEAHAAAVHWGITIEGIFFDDGVSDLEPIASNE